MRTCSEPLLSKDVIDRFGRHLEGKGSADWRQRLLGYLSSLQAHRPDLPLEERVRSWLQSELQMPRRTRDRICGVRTFLNFCGWSALTQELASARSGMALARALAMPGATWAEAIQSAKKTGFESGLSQWLEAYLHHRAGRQMQTTQWFYEFKRLDRIARIHQVGSPEELTASLVEMFLAENHPSPRTRNARLSKLRIWQRFLQSRGGHLSLGPGLAVKEGRFRPHLYTLCEVGRILQALRLRGASRRKFRWLGIETIVFLLYACAMRLREPLRLRLRDVDLERATLFLECTKFYKQRHVPLGKGAERRLAAYVQARREAFPDRTGSDEPFFLTDRGVGFCNSSLGREFATIIDELQIVSRGTRRPRMHDLRHSLAVHRLYQWYAEGADVQNKLPLLSAYLGHDRLHHTEVYLHLTEDLIRQAGRSFQHAFEQVVGRVDR